MRASRTSRILIQFAGACAVVTLGAHVPQLSGFSFIGPASAQSAGHDDGSGHEGGSGGGGGHEDGGHEDGGHSGGGHGEGGHDEVEDGGHVGDKATGGANVAQVPMPGAGSILRVNYFRAELGLSAPTASDAFWLPPGFPTDPQVFFAPVLDRVGFASLAVGHYWAGGYRGEVALTAFGSSTFFGDWTTTVPPSTGPHASVEGSTSAIAVMANGYYEPPILGSGPVQPYVSAGVGLSNNRMEGWTRIQPDGSARRFEGDSQLALAWSLGVGFSVALGELAGRPADLEFGYRYYNLGNVAGSAVPVNGSGGGNPVSPLNFNKTEQTVSVGLRVLF